MKSTVEYFKSIKFSLGYSFKFVPIATWVMIFLYAFSGTINYIIAYTVGKLIDSVVLYTESYDPQIWYLVFAYILASGLPSIISNFQLYVNRKRMIPIQREIELDIMHHRQRIDIAKYEDPKFRDLIQRAFRQNIGPIFQLSASQFDILRGITSFVVGTLVVLNFNPIVYFIVILSAIPNFITDIKFAGQSWNIWAKDSPEQRRLGDLRQHFVLRNYIIEAKLLQSSKKLIEWMRKILLDFNNKQLRLEKNRVWLTTGASILSLVGFGTGLVLILKGVLSGSYQVGTFIFMISTLGNVRSSITQLLETISGQYENHLIVKDIIEFVNTTPVIHESENPTRLSLMNAPEIIFENVSFKYNGSSNYSLKNLSLKFKAGDNIGLVGNNGAGKTTLVKLLCRIYDPTEGRILINGIDLKEIATKEWWSYLSVMFQEYAVYDFVVKEAIAISRPDRPVSLTKVVEVSHTSQAHEFIEKWDKKYDEQLGVEFNGKEPSKGQKQKLSIAKTLYRDGFVMILDEPTASVDAESESKIFDSIESLSKERTAILISHDFSTISACDRIFVLDEGRLIEEGNHKELMTLKGKYAELYNLQAKRFKK